METDDLELFERVVEELNKLADVLERNYTFSGTFRLVLDMYAVIYNAATRCTLGELERQDEAAAELYEKYGELMHTVVVGRPLRLPPQPSCEQTFNAVVRKWAQFKILRQWMLKSFRYLSRFYIVHNNVKSLEEVALAVFFELFQRYSVETGKHLLFLFSAERRGEAVSKEDMRLAIEIFNQMSLVEDGDRLLVRDFTDPFLQDTRAFYLREAAQWSSQLPCSEFLDLAERALKDEEERAQVLPKELRPVLLANVEQQVLAVHLNDIILPPSGFPSMLRDWRVDQMSKVVHTVSRLKNAGLDPVAKVLGKHCRTEGEAVTKRYSNQAEIDFKGYSIDFIELHERYMDLLTNHLTQACFQTAVKDAFEATLNNGITAGTPLALVHSSEMLSQYCDHIMRSAAEKMTDEELDEAFSKIVSLFLRIKDRDHFQEFLRKHLSRRILSSPSLNEELEKSLIAKFKAKCGASFTSKLEGMLSDRSQSMQSCHSFLESENAPRCAFDFTCQVLTMGFWPKFTADRAVVPPQVDEIIKRFSDFYLATGKNKKLLQWNHSLGSATITASFGRGAKEFTMSVHQAIILLLFNNNTKLSLDDLCSSSGLEPDEAKRVAHSFCHPRVRVLIRSPEGAITNTTVFSVNEDFSSAQRKMKMPVTVQRATSQTAAVASVVEEDRKPAVDACIVRIMKSRRQLDHQLLVAEVIEVLRQRFRPDPKLIKMRIEDLINRDFLERMADDPSTYLYLA